MADFTDYFPTIECRVATTKEEHRKIYEWFNVPWNDPCYDGLTSLLTDGSAQCLVVYVNGEGSASAISALVAHEATHCKQIYMGSIGEDNPSDEFEAYVVQSFAQIIAERVMGE